MVMYAGPCCKEVEMVTDNLPAFIQQTYCEVIRVTQENDELEM
jgi:hypothetical protein